jgi:hypothetical protein
MPSTPRRALAPSVEALEGASSREPMVSTDSKSGATLERVVIDGVRYVLKTVDRRTDWIARQAGDIGCWPVVAWEAGLVDLAPPCIDHTVVGAARTATGGAVLMHDASEWLVPPGDAPLPLELHLQFLDHLAAFHSVCWGWTDDLGLCPLGNRYCLFGPASLGTEEALGHPEPVTQTAAEGWEPLRRRARARREPRTPAFRAVAARRRAGDDAVDVRPRRLEARQPRRPARRSHLLMDWSVPGAAPPLIELAHYLALNSARLPVGHSKDDAIAAYRASLERHVDTKPWWDRQLAWCLLGVMLQLAWNKSDGSSDELAWWSARVDEGARALP